MLNIYYGREDIDKERFIYEHIEGRTILIVPDQFTLQAEKDAFFYLHKEAFTDLDVMSFSRLGNKVLGRTGVKRDFIGREGRQMLLTGILSKRKDQLKVFAGSALKQDFVSIVNDLISEFKQHEVTPQRLDEAKAKVEKDSLLYRKLSEIQMIFEDYENAIAGKYTDSEDKISLFAEKTDQADFIKRCGIWIYAFDSFTEKNMTVIKSLECNAREVNLVLTYSEEEKDRELFALTGRLIKRFKRDYPDAGIKRIDDIYKRKMAPGISHMEKELFAAVPKSGDAQEDIKLVRAANSYSQAASAAAHIRSLVRDRGYMYGDIALISNDLESNGQLYKRVFEEYGIRLFIDSKRDITGHPAVMVISSLLSMVERYYRQEDVIRYIKTGLVISRHEADQLQIYAEKFGMGGSRWTKEFTLGTAEYGDEGVAAMEDLRKRLIEPVIRFGKEFSAAETVSDRVDALLKHLEKSCCIIDKLEEMKKEQEASGQLEYAEQTAQIWSSITDIFDQMKEIIGDEDISSKEFRKMLISGLSAVRIGLIPPASDSLVMGSMQRTRRNRIKAAVVIDAAEGMLPRDRDEAGILSDDEKEFLAENDIEICNLGSLMNMEEAMAIYRNLSGAQEHLYMSYAASDNEGRGVSESQIFATVRTMFDIVPEKDIFEKGDIKDLIGGKDAAVNNLIGVMRSMADGEGGTEGKNNDDAVDMWAEVFRWFSEHEDVGKLTDAIIATFGIKRGEGEKASELYSKPSDGILRLSPSRLEKFGKCPFSHFVSYGLRPEEPREYKVDASQTGTICHRCLMEVSQTLSEGLREKKMDITSPSSPWMTVSRSEADEITEKVLSRISEDYNEGLLNRGGEEKYRTDRIKDVCMDSVWVMIGQVRKGNIKEMMFEAGFGENRELPALLVTDRETCGKEPVTEAVPGDVLIEGKIDRCDILDGNYSKIIDYKSGNDSYREAEARQGVKLQLFIYLMASAGKGLKPGGAFYFHIKDAMIKNPEEAKDNHEKEYKMDGFLLGEEQVIDAIDHDKKIFKARNRIMSRHDFDALTEDVMAKVKQMSKDLSAGEIGIKPKKIKDMDACKYCAYRGICKFDLYVEGCSYNMI